MWAIRGARTPLTHSRGYMALKMQPKKLQSYTYALDRKPSRSISTVLSVVKHSNYELRRSLNELSKIKSR